MKTSRFRAAAGRTTAIALGMASLCPLLLFGNQSLSSPSATSEWEVAAGGVQQFDAASIKKAAPDDRWRSNVNLGAMDSPTNGGFFSANVPVGWYIEFAYKLSGAQSLALPSQLPSWATTNRFTIEARAPSGATKDQMRLMTQSLLADRFKLKVHMESRMMPFFALSLAKKGTLGPNLKISKGSSECDEKDTPNNTGADVFPCGVPVSKPLPNGLWIIGGTNLPMSAIANYLWGPGDMDRPLLDRTGLTGTFDFNIRFVRQANGPNVEPDTEKAGPSFLEALREQLGLKMEPTKAPAEVLIIDHIEEPSSN